MSKLLVLALSNFIPLLLAFPFPSPGKHAKIPYQKPFGGAVDFAVEDEEFRQVFPSKSKSSQHVIKRRGTSSLWPCNNLDGREKMIPISSYCSIAGDIPIQNECRVFLHCITAGVTPIVGCCPYGYWFDHKFKRCIPQARALCTDEDLARGKDIVIDTAQDDYQYSVAPNKRMVSVRDDTPQLEPQQPNNQQWQYYPAPDNLFPQAFWSRNPYSGHMWPARFGYAIPISVSYSSTPIKLKKKKKHSKKGKDKEGENKDKDKEPDSGKGKDNDKEKTTTTKRSTPSTESPINPITTGATTKKPTTTSTTPSTTTTSKKPSTATPTTTEHPTTTHKPTTTEKPTTSEKLTTTKPSTTAKPSTAKPTTSATTIKPDTTTSGKFGGDSTDGDISGSREDTGFEIIDPDKHGIRGGSNNTKKVLAPKPGKRKGQEPELIGIPAHSDFKNEEKSAAGTEAESEPPEAIGFPAPNNFKPKSPKKSKGKGQKRGNKPQSVAIINPRPTFDELEEKAPSKVTKSKKQWNPDYGNSEEFDPVKSGIIPLPVNEDRDLLRKRRQN